MFRSRLTAAALKINSCYSSLISERICGPSLNRRLFSQKHTNHSVLQLHEISAELFDKNKNEDIDFQRMMEPYIYTNKTEKLELRSAFVHSLNHWIQLPTEKVKSIIEILHLINSYIVLIDDMMDDPQLRTGAPTAHKIYGYNRTLIGSHALLYIITGKIMALNNNEVLKIFNEEMLKYFKGQSIENCWHLNLKIPTINEYNDLTLLKTAYLGLISRIMQTISNCKQDFTTLNKLLSIYGQYLNDYGSIGEEKYWKSQGYSNDISEGKFSLPIVHAVNTATHEGDIVLNIIRQKTNNVEMKRYCLHLLEKLGSIEYAKQAVRDAELQLREEIERLGGNKIFHELIDATNKWKNDEIPVESTV